MPEAQIGEFEDVYRELRALAGSYFRGRAEGHTLQPTALVNEVYLKFARGDAPPEDRSHFFAVAATAMRQILIDHARKKQAAKRGGDGPLLREEESPVDVVALDELLDKLAEVNELQAKIVELRFFAGLTVPEVADALDTSVRSVERHWRFARAWLLRELDG